MTTWSRLLVIAPSWDSMGLAGLGWIEAKMEGSVSVAEIPPVGVPH